MARCLIGCGSNQGRPRQYLDDARELLRAMPGVTLVAASRPRETRPIGGPPGQPAFLNGAFLLETDFSPTDVLGVLQAIENTLHRERSERWGPRTIDLDLLLYDDAVIDEPALTVPHPRMSTRRFVLEPCAEIAPEFVHPLAGCSVRDLLAAVSSDHLHVAVVGVPGSGAPEVAAAVADITLARLLHAPAAPPFCGDDEPTFARRWEDALAECAGVLRDDAWPTDPHGTISDFWLGAFPLAAEGCLPASRIAAAFERAERGTTAPHAAILLLADPGVLEERLAFRRRRPAPQTDMFADLAPGGTAVADAPPAATVAALVALQEKLRRHLHAPSAGTDRRPKAVVVVEANELGAAIDEAVAAVEAMA
ncbi:MAG: 2-amino-4-hydroxy-6-hydroxymethyldihydropteridine diphosphokinase [Planctomycetia bacterium]